MLKLVAHTARLTVHRQHVLSVQGVFNQLVHLGLGLVVLKSNFLLDTATKLHIDERIKAALEVA